MNADHARCDRRALLRRLGCCGIALVAGPMLAGCGDGGREAAATVLSDDARRLNLAINIGYLAAEYHSRAAGGAGVPMELTGGVGRPGRVLGVRSASFAFRETAAMAADIGSDKIERLATLRRSAGAAAAAMPTLDLSSAPRAAFSTVARAARLISHASFDPYASDDNFLLGAFVLEDGTAAALRGLSDGANDAGASSALDEAAADATYHGALIRTMIERRSAENPALLDASARLRAVLSEIGGTDIDGRPHEEYMTDGENPRDAAEASPFVRSPNQALRAILLNNGRSGGFLPFGANGTS